MFIFNANRKQQKPATATRSDYTAKTVEQIPNQRQYYYLQMLEPILEQRRYHSQEHTCRILRDMGFHPTMKRVKWAGGVGSWRIMKGGKLRLQIAASVQGFNNKKLGFRYALCVEF